MNWPPYPEYKTSGIEWLGDIPSSWGVAEIKLTHQVTLGKMLQTEATGSGDALLPYLRAAHIPPTGFTLNDPKEMWFTPKEKSELTLKKGDVVVVEGGMGGYGRCDIVPEDVPGWGFQNSINRLRPKNCNNGAFTKYLLQIARENGYIDVLCSVSTMPHLTAEKLGAIRLPLPTVDEQRKIGDFLDRETAKIDALIGKQEQLIASLREDRAATITHAVTEGLDPNVEMKASGLPWAGDIPRHWEAVPIKHVVRSVGVGLVINPSTYVADSGVPFLLGRNVRDGWIELANVNYMSEEDSRRLKASRLKAGDVVVVRAGYPGRAAVISAELDGANCASILILRQPTLARPEFVAAFFNSRLGRAQVKLAQYGAAQEQINVGDVVNFVMPVPPVSEQQEIAEWISAKTAAIDTLIDKANEVIDTSREYRSALITDAVTGKIDVRGAA
jgi:type I restriction enzyme S subunit